MLIDMVNVDEGVTRLTLKNGKDMGTVEIHGDFDETADVEKVPLTSSEDLF